MEGTVETSTQTTEAPPPTDSSSVADHAAQFGPQATRDDAGDPPPPFNPPRVRHRAPSQRATPEDVTQINALTKELRAKEAELGKVRPDAIAGSPRLLALRRQIKAIEAELSEHAKPAPTPPPSAPISHAPITGTTFDEPEPKLEDFAAQEDPWTAWQRALGKWDRKKEAFEEKHAAATQQSEAQRTARQTEIDTAYATRLQAFITTAPDFAEKFHAASARYNGYIPEILIRAIKEDDNGPALLYHLLTHPSDFDEMQLLSEGKSISETSVALLRRRLSSLSRSQAVQTGSAVATVPPSLAFRPPNPVRTGPMKTGDEPPGGDLSIAEHAKYYGPKRR